MKAKNNGLSEDNNNPNESNPGNSPKKKSQYHYTAIVSLQQLKFDTVYKKTVSIFQIDPDNNNNF